MKYIKTFEGYVQELDEKCWTGYKMVGMKKKGKRQVPNCVPESVSSDGKVICDNCKWEWDIVQGGDDPYTCHKCGHKTSEVSEKESPYDKETLDKYKKEYEEGKDIPFGIKSSLIAQGMIAREGGPDKGKKVKSEEYK